MQQCESEEKREKMAEIVKSKEENPQINLHIQRERRDFASFIVIYYMLNVGDSSFIHSFRLN